MREERGGEKRNERERERGAIQSTNPQGAYWKEEEGEAWRSREERQEGDGHRQQREEEGQPS